MEPMKYGEGRKSGKEWNNPSLYINQINFFWDTLGPKVTVVARVQQCLRLLFYEWLFGVSLRGPYKNFKNTPVKYCLDNGAPKILRSSTSSLGVLRPSRSISRLLDHVVTPSRILRHRFASRRGESKISARFE